MAVKIISLAVLFVATVTQDLVEGKTVNVLLFYEQPESVKSFDAAIDYIRYNKSLDIEIGYVHKVNSNGTDAIKLITNLCKEVDAAFNGFAESKPDIIVDFTRKGIQSEAVKLITKVMTLPTVSGSFGQKGDIKTWKDLSEKQKKYLIQVVPPADMLPQAVRALVIKQKMMNVATLHDDDFDWHRKHEAFTSFYGNTRLNLSKLEKTTKNIRDQINKFANFSNFFVASSPSEISRVLAEASNDEVMTGSLVSKEYSWYSMSMDLGLPKCTGCSDNVSVIHLEPELSQAGRDRRAFLLARDYFIGQNLMDMFYFDLTMSAILAVNTMKINGQWVSPPKRVCRDTETSNDDYNLPLFDNIKEANVSKENVVGSFYFDDTKEIGSNFPNFKMVIRRLQFAPETGIPLTNVKIGVWHTGSGGSGLLTSWPNLDNEWESHKPVKFELSMANSSDPSFY